MLKILVTNDDGIDAPGIAKLAACAAKLGTVTVVAPKSQCSGMSHHITLNRPMELKERLDFPVKGVKAYSLDGTPADCRLSTGCLIRTPGERVPERRRILNRIRIFRTLCFPGSMRGPMQAMILFIQELSEPRWKQYSTESRLSVFPRNRRDVMRLQTGIWIKSPES